MRTSAPSAFAFSSFASLELVVKTVHPASFATWIAAVETPEPAPRMRTSSPGLTFARVMSIRHAVMNASGTAAACGKSISVGILSTLRAGTATFSAYVPGRCSPRILYSTHSESSPRRQYSQRPQEIPGFTTTRSPISTSGTSEPTSAMSPAASQPRMWGSVSFRVGIPSRTARSRWFRDAAWTRTTTWSGPAGGQALLQVPGELLRLVRFRLQASHDGHRFPVAARVHLDRQLGRLAAQVLADADLLRQPACRADPRDQAASNGVSFSARDSFSRR